MIDIDQPPPDLPEEECNCPYAEFMRKGDLFGKMEIPMPCERCAAERERWEARCEAEHERQRACLPPVLVKACMDNFDYVIGLSDGSYFLFAQCYLSQDGLWLSLEEIKAVEGPASRWNLERGVDVRIHTIVYAVDAPEGS